MTDRELLELAAKAAGLEVLNKDLPGDSATMVTAGLYTHLGHWNPLFDDGDAFRLAIDLALFDDATAYSAGLIIDEDEYAKFRKTIVEKAADMQRSKEHFHEPYWLCCGSRDKTHSDDRGRSCVEAQQGHPERCVYATAYEHKMSGRA